MSNIIGFSSLVQFANKKISENPDLTKQIRGAVTMARDEMQAGESEDNEVDTAVQYINELIESKGRV